MVLVQHVLVFVLLLPVGRAASVNECTMNSDVMSGGLITSTGTGPPGAPVSPLGSVHVPRACHVLFQPVLLVPWEIVLVPGHQPLLWELPGGPEMAPPKLGPCMLGGGRGGRG